MTDGLNEHAPAGSMTEYPTLETDGKFESVNDLGVGDAVVYRSRYGGCRDYSGVVGIGKVISVRNNAVRGIEVQFEGLERALWYSARNLAVVRDGKIAPFHPKRMTLPERRIPQESGTKSSTATARACSTENYYQFAGGV